MKNLTVDQRAGAYQAVNECVIELENQERPACVAEIVSLFYPA
jgi:hypothetical protein